MKTVWIVILGVILLIGLGLGLYMVSSAIGGVAQTLQTDIQTIEDLPSTISKGLKEELSNVSDLFERTGKKIENIGSEAWRNVEREAGDIEKGIGREAKDVEKDIADIGRGVVADVKHLGHGFESTAKHGYRVVKKDTTKAWQAVEHGGQNILKEGHQIYHDSLDGAKEVDHTLADIAHGRVGKAEKDAKKVYESASRAVSHLFGGSHHHKHKKHH